MSYPYAVDSGGKLSKSGENRLHFNLPVERQAQRFRELIVYVSKKCENDRFFGAVKLNKILFHSDFRAVERFGWPLTGVTYFRLPQGPAPKPLLIYRSHLVEEGAIRIDRVPIGNLMQDRTIALRSPVMTHFSEDEVILVDQVVSELWSQTATEVSDASHDVRWRVLQNRDSLPYEFAFLDARPLTQADQDKTLELAREFGW